MSYDIFDADYRNKILELIPSGVGIFDVKDGVVNMVFINDGYYQMIKSTRDNRIVFEGKSTINAIHPSDRAGLLEEEKASVLEKRMFQYKFRIMCGDGVYRWIAIRANHYTQKDQSERFFASYYDIDSLINTQKKLHDSEVLFHDFLLHSDSVHFVYYPQERRYEISILPAKIADFPKTMDGLPDSFIKFVSLNKKAAADLTKALKEIDEGAKESECIIQAKFHEKTVWCHIMLLNYLDAEGHSLKAIGNVVSVDKLKEAESSFNEEKLLMKSLKGDILSVSCFNVTKDLPIELDQGTTPQQIDLVNDAIYKEALSINPDLSKQNLTTFKVLLSNAKQIPNEKERTKFIDSFSHLGMMRAFSSGQKEVSLEYRRWTEKGLIWVCTRLALVNDPLSGDVLAFFSTSDINDIVIFRKISSQVIDKTFDTVSYYDVNTKKVFVKSFSDSSSISFKAYPYEGLFENLFTQYILPSEAEEVRRDFRIEAVIKGLENTSTYSVYCTSKLKDTSLPGSPNRRLENDFFYLDEEKDVIVILQKDITKLFEQERKNREEMARTMEALRKANTSKSEFLSRISHDIRTPISIISSLTDFALSDIKDQEKLKDDLMKIKTADSFLLSLINDVLDISKIDSGKIDLVPVPYALKEYNASISTLLKTLCEEKGLSCELTYKGEQDDVVLFVDNVRLNQITLNLLSNSVKYSKKNGKVSFSSFCQSKGEDYLFGFEVSDDGIGMSEEFQKKMFDPFTQEYDNPHRPQGTTGTGLGLSIVKRMVDLMGGKIEVNSQLGKGTTIRCTFELKNGRTISRCKEDLDQINKEKGDLKLTGHILLAEDNEVNAEIATRILESFGLTVDCADNGKKAVEMYTSAAPGTYQAILMDIQMPVLDGYGATRQIRASSIKDAKTIPIIALTADAFSDAILKGKEAGMDDYLVKPLNPPRMRSLLSEAINKSKI
ncbi:MAG: ATP-binding protein [Bacilli bacterium]|nr:ATP-binding protein [Bacilli bacterium]